ncbi:hypothetical protein MNBD_GAMMA12-1081 [hydrothermal vent metagenome]|uniref:Uncharacterized protein n=1 Tax=hydrothermal vent metagenome TaxID=652676 RepID=A0A3B0Z8U1_9ZZZZ
MRYKTIDSQGVQSGKLYANISDDGDSTVFNLQYVDCKSRN